jgi:hypothetical protein
MNSSKCPRDNCIAFDKLDGSNIRVKYTQKKGFCLFGSRTQLIDETHPHLGKSISLFKENCEQPLSKVIKKLWPDEREIIVFGEFIGEKSFAGIHQTDDKHKLVIFDVLIGHKNRKFLLPQEFIKILGEVVEIPRIIYSGNLTDDFIKRVREGEFDVFEGVVCKGTIRRGDYRGGVWSAKIKTNKYIDLLKQKFGEEGVKKYGE